MIVPNYLDTNEDQNSAFDQMDLRFFTVDTDEPPAILMEEDEKSRKSLAKEHEPYQAYESADQADGLVTYADHLNTSHLSHPNRCHTILEVSEDQTANNGSPADHQIPLNSVRVVEMESSIQSRV